MQDDGVGNRDIFQADAAATEFQFPPDLARDHELLMATELHIGATPISKLSPKTARPMWVRFRQAGLLCNRAYRSASAWRVKVTYALKNNEPLQCWRWMNGAG